MRYIDDEALKRMVAIGLIPSIEDEIQKYRNGADSNVSLYYTAVNIGRYVDTYHNICHTGNIVECVQPTIIEADRSRYDRHNNKHNSKP